MTKNEEIWSQARQGVTRPIHFLLHNASPKPNCNNASFFNEENTWNSTCVSTIIKEKKKEKNVRLYMGAIPAHYLHFLLQHVTTRCLCEQSLPYTSKKMVSFWGLVKSKFFNCLIIIPSTRIKVKKVLSF